MFVYSFLEKNLACAFLFDTVRLSIFEVSRFLVENFENILLMNRSFCSMFNTCMFHRNVSLYSGSPCGFINFLEKFLPCAIISSCAFINFWRISCPVRLFHTVRLLGSQEYFAFIFFETEILFIFHYECQNVCYSHYWLYMDTAWIDLEFLSIYWLSTYFHGLQGNQDVKLWSHNAY